MSGPLDQAIASLEEQANAARAAGEQHKEQTNQLLQQFNAGVSDALDDEVAGRVTAAAQDAFGAVNAAVDQAWETITTSIDQEKNKVEELKSGG